MLFNWNAGMHGSKSGGNAVRDKSDVKFRMVYDIAGARIYIFLTHKLNKNFYTPVKNHSTYIQVLRYELIFNRSILR